MRALTKQGMLAVADIYAFRDLLREAFVTRARFSDFLGARLNRRFDDYYGEGDDYPHALAKVVAAANAEMWWRELLREARNATPSNPGFIEFAEWFDQAPAWVASNGHGATHRLIGRELELCIKKANPVADIVLFRERLGEIEGRVCRIEHPAGKARGTGFLVGPDVVITNYHVIEEIVADPQLASGVRLRFDYKVRSDGVGVGSGTAYTLAEDWLLDHSPYSPRDLELKPATDPGPDELDYALVRVAGKPGDEPVGGTTMDSGKVPRKWIRAAKAHDFGARTSLFIVQHPDGKPMQVALDTEAVIGTNHNKTRVRYTTTTEPGSSGSPCFNSEWEWVALHHAGDPKYQIGRNPEYNQGIPVAAIVARLEATGKEALLAG